MNRPEPKLTATWVEVSPQLGITHQIVVSSNGVLELIHNPLHTDIIFIRHPNLTQVLGYGADVQKFYEARIERL